ncbi:2830_t:CDS:2 [Scutellospora calospora]|uniref:2830_t:CDS:1 n=1 Tax=Scutellospora calospora TaxID=85575 RepID=A0ACA9LDL0_9GLOM|nr:2830_t:CDS:2 [Scutellospora calospora]
MNSFIAENKEFSRFLEGKNDTYNDPDYKYALLDDSHSEVSCNSTTTNTTKSSNLVENNENFTFTKAMMNFIKAYTDSQPTNDNNLEEININWLDSETDIISEVGSIVDFDNEKELDIEINDYEETSEPCKQCNVLDIKDGKIQRCLNPRFRPLKQLSGVWELDFQTVDPMFKQNQIKMLETLSVDYEIEQEKVEPPSEVLIKIVLHLQNVNLNKLNNQEQISAMIEKQPE